MMDKIEGKNVDAVRDEQIDFDYKSFKDSCLAANGGKGINVNEKWDG